MDDGGDESTVSVSFVDEDVDVFTAYFLDECAFDVPAVIEPVAILVLGHLVPFRCVEACESDVVLGDFDAICIGHPGFAIKTWRWSVN